MIESPQLVAKILTGAKTQTTRPRRAGVQCRWQPGHSYGVRTGSRKPEVTRIKVRAVREALLHELTDDDARAEGFADVDELFHGFYEQHGMGPGYDRQHPSWPFAIVPVWVITFELDLEAPPRLLGRRARTVGPAASPDAARGYVTNHRDELEDAGEAVPEAFQDQLSAEAQGRLAKLRAEERDREETQRITARLRQAKARARAAGVDVSAQVREIEKQLKSIEANLP